MIEAVAGESILGRARQKGLIDVEAVNLRDFTSDKHRTTDDSPFGGGPGMVMKPRARIRRGGGSGLAQAGRSRGYC